MDKGFHLAGMNHLESIKEGDLPLMFLLNEGRYLETQTACMTSYDQDTVQFPATGLMLINGWVKWIFSDMQEVICSSSSWVDLKFFYGIVNTKCMLQRQSNSKSNNFGWNLSNWRSKTVAVAASMTTGNRTVANKPSKLEPKGRDLRWCQKSKKWTKQGTDVSPQPENPSSAASVLL